MRSPHEANALGEPNACQMSTADLRPYLALRVGRRFRRPRMGFSGGPSGGGAQRNWSSFSFTFDSTVPFSTRIKSGKSI